MTKLRRGSIGVLRVGLVGSLFLAHVLAVFDEFEKLLT